MEAEAGTVETRRPPRPNLPPKKATRMPIGEGFRRGQFTSLPLASCCTKWWVLPPSSDEARARSPRLRWPSRSARTTARLDALGAPSATITRSAGAETNAVEYSGNDHSLPRHVIASTSKRDTAPRPRERYRPRGTVKLTWRCCTARSKSLTSLWRSQSHPAQYVSGIPSAVILLSISHPIRCSTRCLASVRARISGPMIAL